MNLRYKGGPYLTQSVIRLFDLTASGSGMGAMNFVSRATKDFSS